MKRGVTLIELLVAMGIFAVISSVAIAAYITVGNLKAVSFATRESQQKIRIASETITRLARQANIVLVSNSGRTLDLYMDIKGTPRAARFEINSTGTALNYYNGCSGITVASPICGAGSWNTAQNLLSNDLVLKSSSVFVKIADKGHPELTVTLNGNFGANISKVYYKDDFNLTTNVILENIK